MVRYNELVVVIVVVRGGAMRTSGATSTSVVDAIVSAGLEHERYQEFGGRAEHE
jgi:predicted transcriptional regulator